MSLEQEMDKFIIENKLIAIEEGSIHSEMMGIGCFDLNGDVRYVIGKKYNNEPVKISTIHMGNVSKQEESFDIWKNNDFSKAILEEFFQRMEEM